MMSSKTSRYRDLCFEHKNLTRISGEPTFASLYKILLELKDNAVSTPIILGGGSYGFIVIILPNPTYATIAPMIPLVTPVQLFPLRITDVAT